MEGTGEGCESLCSLKLPYCVSTILSSIVGIDCRFFFSGPKRPPPLHASMTYRAMSAGVFDSWQSNSCRKGRRIETKVSVVARSSRVQFNKAFTSAIYECSYCFQTLKQWLHLKKFYKIDPRLVVRLRADNPLPSNPIITESRGRGNSLGSRKHCDHSSQWA